MPVTTVVAMDSSGIVDLVQRAFAIDVSAVKALAGELDLNFHLEANDGASYLLKIHRVGADEAELQMQDLLLRFVAGRGCVSPDLIGSVVLDSADAPLSGLIARLLSWIDGGLWSDQNHHDEAALFSLGAKVAQLDAALKGFDHVSLDRRHRWNMQQVAYLRTPADQWAARTLAHFESSVLSRLDALGSQAIHNDANDNNIVIDTNGIVHALIDFGDVVRGPRIIGLGVAVAYAMLGQRDPLAAACAVVSGYHDECPLLPEELSVLDDLVRTRLAMSIANAEEQLEEHLDNAAYLTISQAPIRELVELLSHIEGPLAHASYRNACGFVPVAAQREVERFFASAQFDPAPIVDIDLSNAPVLDWSVDKVGTSQLPSDGIAIGRYREDRAVYDADDFATPFGERRTLHLAIDVFVPARSSVHAPLDAIVRAADIRGDRGDYGGVIILEHVTPVGVAFWLLIGHLSHACIADLKVGQNVARGEVVGVVGMKHENGGWPPHLHAQLYTDLLGKTTDIAGVARRSELDVRESISPNPAPLLVGVDPVAAQVPVSRSNAAIARRRRLNVSTSLSLSYRQPIHMVRGEGASLIDAEGNRWLDLVNNVAHVGHEHPRVVRALQDQAGKLNTNTRYLHPNIVEYAERMRALFPDPLSVMFFTNSGSEANDLALRLARTATGRESVLTMDWGYHGNLNSLIEISPYKFNRKGGNGPSERIRICELPDPYRGRFGNDGAAYAVDVQRRAEDLASAGRPPAAFIHESISGCGGQVDLATGYLAAAYEHARSAGAVVVADEVQCGMGRVGTHMWAFESHGVVPDIVTLGKPVGNGHPLGIVVTTPQIARQFRNGMEYFNTFAGNPVSCAVGVAVLDVMRDQRLMGHAASVGAGLRAQLVKLMDRHSVIGDVRGRGLFLGVDLVTDRETKAPASVLSASVLEGMKRRGILLSSDGPHDNVLKIKPPMVISGGECRRVVEALDECLHELG